jgi:hypothetical protein
MAQDGKRAFSFRMTLGTANFVAAAMLAVGTTILVNGSLLPEMAIQASTNAARDVAVLLAGSLVLAVLLALGSQADRRCADDYAYQLLATGAMIGMFTTIGANIFWALDFLPDAIGIRDMRGQDQMAIGMIGWGVAYFTFRIRGLR